MKKILPENIGGKKEKVKGLIKKEVCIMAIVRFEPRRSVDRMSRDFRSLFESFFGSPFNVRFDGDFAPSVDVIEEKDRIIFQAELPGIKKEDIKVKFTDNVLTISGHSDARKEEKERRYVYSERSYGEFSRSFTMPDFVDPSSIKADYKDGVLMIEIKKKEQAKPKEIEVNVG